MNEYVEVANELPHGEPMRLRIYGASDDIVCCDGDLQGEIGCWNRTVEVLLVGADEQATLLEIEHTSTHGWRVTVMCVGDDDHPMVPMEIQLADNGYSPVVLATVVAIRWRVPMNSNFWEVPR